MAQTDLAKAEERAVKQGDCRYWEPIDALHAAARDVANGVITPQTIYIAIEETDGTLRFFAAGGSRQELDALLEKHQQKRLKRR